MASLYKHGKLEIYKVLYLSVTIINLAIFKILNLAGTNFTILSSHTYQVKSKFPTVSSNEEPS